MKKCTHKAVYILVLISTLFLTSAEGAPPLANLPPEMTMHRFQSGEIDQSGWSYAKSTMGEFSVQLPGKFNDFSVEIPGKDGVPIFNHTVGTMTAEGVKFSASCLISNTYKAETNPINAIAEGFKENSLFFEMHSVRTQNMEGVEVHVGNGVTNAYIRVFQNGSRLFLLTVEYPNIFERDLFPIAMKFMESFQVN